MYWLWSFLLSKFMAHLASFWLEMMFVFSNTLSTFKVKPRSSNLTKFDMLTLSSSNMIAPTLKINEHFKKRTNHVFLSSFCQIQLKSYFFTLYFISGIYKKIMYSITFSYSHDCQKVAKNPFFLFFFFNSINPTGR